ncbi:MAG: hypothetical protein R2798_08475 [Chitinophagales bacterium]|nr:hypothetical protein [Bacteroidota bacterium]MCB9042464.1 hypothetical protein [Chitinophagales bacterium]
MRNLLAYFILFSFGFSISAQENETSHYPKTIYYWEIGIMGSELSLEHTFRDFWIAKAGVGYEGAIFRDFPYDELYWGFTPTLKLEMRYNKFSKQRRINKGKDITRNAGSHLGLVFLQNFPEFNIDYINGNKVTAPNGRYVGLSFGIRRNFWKYFSFNYTASLGSYLVRKEAKGFMELRWYVHFN